MTRDIECFYKEVLRFVLKEAREAGPLERNYCYGGGCLMLSFRLCCVKMFLSKLLFLICVDVLQDIAQSKPFPPCEEFFSNITPSLIFRATHWPTHHSVSILSVSSFFTLLFGKRLQRLSHGLTRVYNLHALSSFLYCAIPWWNVPLHGIE